MSSKKIEKPKKVKKETASTAFRLPIDLKREIEQIAESENRSTSNWLIKIVKEAINKNR
jgi:hypothetical protein